MGGRTLLLAMVSLIVPLGAVSAAAAEAGKNPIVVLKTSLGTIEIELFPDKAPITVKNFLDYVNSGFYDGTVFHRVIPGFMIQGGGFTKDLKEKETRAPIKNEADNGLKNDRGTVAMARTSKVDSATAQFFINVKDNESLNHRDDTERGYGYAVFGRVIQGMDVVDKIVDQPRSEQVATVTNGARQEFEDVPNTPIVIESAKVKKKGSS